MRILVVLQFAIFFSFVNSTRIECYAGLKEGDRPNILFIFTDDQSHRTVGCYPESYPWVKTPAIDRLAAGGMRFEYAYLGNWCMPSRASILTGHHQFGIESMRMEGEYPGSEYDPEKCKFWPSVFRENGYETAHIGKWHTGTDTGFGRDWDFQIVWNRPRFPRTSQNYYYDQPITYHGNETKILKRYSTDQYTDWAIEYLKGQSVAGKKRNANKPFFLWLCYAAVHSPFTPANRHQEEYEGVKIPVPADVFPPRKGKPNWGQEINMWEKGADGHPARNGKRLYDETRQYHQSVLALDESVQRVVDVLDSTGLRENTIIVFTSDQGYAWGQHGYRMKVGPYDATIRSPLIFNMPGTIPKNSVCSVPVGGIDIVPTLFRYAGIKLPWRMDGHDLSPLLKNPDSNWSHRFMLAATGMKFGSATKNLPKTAGEYHNKVPWYVMIRFGKFKYIRPMIHDYEELYDLEADPDELVNLAMNRKYQSMLEKCRDEAIQELKRNQAPFVDKLPSVRKKF